METQNYKTVSVRLCEAEYRALQEQAGKDIPQCQACLDG